MTKRYEPIDTSKLKTFSIGRREHKVVLDGLAKLPEAGASAAELIDSLPSFLGAAHFNAVVDAIVAARRADRPVVFAMGAHVVKVGCGPIVVDLIRRGIVTAVAGNGATAIHDAELACDGQTSEDVAETLGDGRFGMVRETAEFFAEAATMGGRDGIGLGAAVGHLLVEQDRPHVDVSILAAAHRAGIPATIHVAVGTDTVHMHPQMDGALLGQATMTDFRLICSVVADLGAAKAGGPGGVWCNIGSAVLLPEVFLKAVAIARNLGSDLDAMVTANFDMLGQYRARQNVVLRPPLPGNGHEVIGQHEILLPLLRQALVEKLS
ncbi:MAG: hypothetical protein JXQ73_23855 [Phycisphaerae bacterium]|nr:hypothetical protein [Phycisphaerae bacterium]